MSVDVMGSVSDSDVAVVRNLIERSEATEFFRDRRIRNVALPPPEFSSDELWRVLLGCLLTTRQRSTKGSPVDVFLEAKPFPLAFDTCKKERSVRRFVLKTIKSSRGIRFGPKISRFAAENWKRLDRGLWTEAQDWFDRLLQQRSREPRQGDFLVEREAAHWAQCFAGLGPKQSRNFWQWLGLTRYEIPLDGRVTDWVNKNLRCKIDADRLSRLRYYESALECIQKICAKAAVLPCEFDAAAFDYEDMGAANGGVQRIIDPGFINQYRQITVRNTGMVADADPSGLVYQLACSLCGHIYGASESDIRDRKCPACQDGLPGLNPNIAS